MATIKFSSWRSILHESNQFSKENEDFIKGIEKELNSKLQYASIDDYNCDLKLIFIQSGGSEMLFLNDMNKLKEPYYLLTSGSNNSLAASLEILTYLNNNNLKGEIIHGDFKYIASRINYLASKKKIDIISNQRFGIIGKPSDWLISSIPNYKQLEDKFNIKLVDIPLSEIDSNYLSFNVNENIESLGFDKKEVINASKVSGLLENIADKYSLNGLTIRCFDLLSSIKTTGCLGLANLNKKGIISTCEGDIMAMISMAIIKAISGQSSFQANPSKVDITNKKVIFAHCTLPLDMVDKFHFDSHFESKIGLAIKGELKEDIVTVFRLSSDLKSLFVRSGKIIRNLNEPNLCRTQIEVEFDEDISELLINPKGNHHIICYGNYVNQIKELFK